MSNSMESPYKLRCSLHGHSSHVRAICSTPSPENGMVSGSRDRTVRLWLPDRSSENGFTERMCMTGPTNFISSICCFPADDKNPQGLIMVGSFDSFIYCFSPLSAQPLYKLEGHSETVCSLAAGKFGSLVSGSWDKSAKVWLGEKNIMTLVGHEAAVWAVQILPEQGLILTASADKSIKAWKAGKCEYTFTGHSDCVRSLAIVDSEHFLSCANDASIRYWSVSSRRCLHVYYGHTSFIYSISIIGNGEYFLTSSEDRSIKIWKTSCHHNQSDENDNSIQTIRLPAQSIWCTASLNNGDIAVGSSDGIIRVFTKDPKREASQEEQRALEEQTAQSSLNTSDIGGLKVKDLPSKEALFEPGKKDGQTKMVRDGASISAYQWSASDQQWKKIGDVVGANNKTMHEGVEYDYVFTIDIEEGKPPIQLPYNLDEDPWFAAQKFIDKHNLSSVFLEQVANFIVENTKGTAGSSQSTSSNVVSDPFTGGNRYIPSGGSNTSNSNIASDPFTGAGRYVPGNSSTTNVNNTSDPFTGAGRYVPHAAGMNGPQEQPQLEQQSNQYFPQLSYVKFESANIEAIVTKLYQFNGQQQCQLTEQQINHLQKSMTNACPVSFNDLKSCLDIIFTWPQEMVFPAIDILRISLKSDKMIKSLNENGMIPEIINILLNYISVSTPVANHMLALRALCNLFSPQVSEEVLYDYRHQILEKVVSEIRNPTSKPLQIALATLLLNYSILICKKDDLELKTQLISGVVSTLDSFTEGEAMFRILVCLGTLVYNDTNAIDTAKSFDMLIVVKKYREVIDPSKVGECAKLLEQLFIANV
ncbi:Phospholipase A-2-activating protein [Nymphon striatum]|nr:Phospholipase A-2-activating protein [Nymphon striatum]